MTPGVMNDQAEPLCEKALRNLWQYHYQHKDTEFVQECQRLATPATEALRRYLLACERDEPIPPEIEQEAELARRFGQILNSSPPHPELWQSEKVREYMFLCLSRGSTDMFLEVAEHLISIEKYDVVFKYIVQRGLPDERFKWLLASQNIPAHNLFQVMRQLARRSPEDALATLSIIAYRNNAAHPETLELVRTILRTIHRHKDPLLCGSAAGIVFQTHDWWAHHKDVFALTSECARQALSSPEACADVCAGLFLGLAIYPDDLELSVTRTLPSLLPEMILRVVRACQDPDRDTSLAKSIRMLVMRLAVCNYPWVDQVLRQVVESEPDHPVIIGAVYDFQGSLNPPAAMGFAEDVVWSTMNAALRILTARDSVEAGSLQPNPWMSNTPRELWASVATVLSYMVETRETRPPLETGQLLLKAICKMEPHANLATFDEAIDSAQDWPTLTALATKMGSHVQSEDSKEVISVFQNLRVADDSMEVIPEELQLDS